MERWLSRVRSVTERGFSVEPDQNDPEEEEGDGGLVGCVPYCTI